MFAAIREEYRLHGRHVRHAGLWAVLIYRFGVWALHLRWRVMRWAAGKIYAVLHFLVMPLSGVYVDRQATIGPRFRILHPGGIYISNRVVIGEGVTVMQNVTIGVDPLGRAPKIEDGVFIATGACVAGHITVGAGSRIGPNAVVMRDVPPHSLVMAPAPTVMPNLSVTTEQVKHRRATWSPGTGDVSTDQPDEPGPRHAAG